MIDGSSAFLFSYATTGKAGKNVAEENSFYICSGFSLPAKIRQSQVGFTFLINSGLLIGK
jgi:hypothetical protein